SQLLRAINRTKRRTLLKVGEPFDLEVVKEERMRIDTRLKQRGFYFFSPDHLLIDVDSTIGEQRVNLYVNLKPTTPPKARRVYRINEVVIYPRYSINATEADTSREFAQLHQGYYVVDSSRFYTPKLFQQAMQFNKG